MADQPTPKALDCLTARDQEILVAALSKCLKNGDIQIDYAKLATKAGLGNAKSATAAWNRIKTKVFGKASTQAGNADGPENKVTKTPSKPKEPKEPKTPKTPASTNKKAAKTVIEIEKEEEIDAASDEEADENDSEVRVEVTVAHGADSPSAAVVETNYDDEATTKDADGDSTMIDTPESAQRMKVKASATDEMSSGDMSPPTTPARIKAKKTTTPRANAKPKTPKTPKTPTAEAANATPGNATETPVPGSSGAKKRGRKTKAQKEDEAATAGKNGATESGDEDEEEKPAKKARKTPVKKVKPNGDAEDANTAGAGEGGDVGKENPVKKPRKPAVKKEKNNGTAPMGDSSAAGEVVKEKKKPGLKPGTPKAKKEMKDDATQANGESSPAGEAVNEKKKPGPKPVATKGKKVEKAVEPPEASDDDAEEENVSQEDGTNVAEEAQAANDVLTGKKIDTKTVSTTPALAIPANWGTSVNSPSPSPAKGTVTVQLGREVAAATANDEVERDTIVVRDEVVQSIETEDGDDDEAGDTITVATK